VTSSCPVVRADTRPVLRDVDLIHAVQIGCLGRAEELTHSLLGMFQNSLSWEGLVEQVILLQNQRRDLGEFLMETLFTGHLYHRSPTETVSEVAVI